MVEDLLDVVVALVELVRELIPDVLFQRSMRELAHQNEYSVGLELRSRVDELRSTGEIVILFKPEKGLVEVIDDLLLIFGYFCVDKDIDDDNLLVKLFSEKRRRLEKADLIQDSDQLRRIIFNISLF